jgi:hypothetical protein
MAFYYSKNGFFSPGKCHFCPKESFFPFTRVHRKARNITAFPVRTRVKGEKSYNAIAQILLLSTFVENYLKSIRRFCKIIYPSFPCKGGVAPAAWGICILSIHSTPFLL